MVRRLSLEDRAELQAPLELLLIEGELRTDEALKLQEQLRPADARPRLDGR